MSINAQGYFDHLRAYLNMDFYGIEPSQGSLILKEKIFTPKGRTTIKVMLTTDGQCFGIKLDKRGKKDRHNPLFHFLEDTGKPWSKRCDFVVFHLYRNKLSAHCIEFKYETLAADSIVAQLDSSAAWCRAMWGAIKTYTGLSKRLHISKYVLSRHPNPLPYLDKSGKYLKSDQSVRHYLYSEIKGISIEDLENTCVDCIV